MITIEPMDEPRGIVVFGSGAGGDPGRYSALLEGFADAGFIVVAPLHDRLDGRNISNEQLRTRVEGLQDALATRHENALPVIATGHSIGGCAALCLAGAQPSGRDGQAFKVPVETRTQRLVLFAPALDWFRAPHALNQVAVPLTVHSGSEDIITPASTTHALRSASRAVRSHVYENVGHFDFMTDLPPGVNLTPGLDHDAFLQTVRLHIGRDLA